MIYIREGKPRKLPGVTTLFIKFDYDEYIRDTLRQLDFRYYHKDTLEWEVPINKLSYLLDMFLVKDKVRLTTLKTEVKQEVVIPQEYKFKTKPYEYQLEGIKYGLNHDSWLLLDQMGLGKSLQILYLAEVLHYMHQIEHCLIICGVNSLKYNWESEVKKHSKLDCMILGSRYNKAGKRHIGSVKERVEDLLKPINEFFIITNIETLREEKVVQALKKQINKIDMIVLDEAHKAKSPTSSQGKNLLKLSWPRRKVALTGTILLNSPLDAYVPLKWIGYDCATYSKFKQQYCEYGGFRGVQIIGYKNLDMLQEQIKQISLRRKKEDVLDLPPKTYKNEYVEMNTEQEKFYEEIRQGILCEMDKVRINPDYAQALTIRLRQATAWTGALSTVVQQSAKLDRLEELIAEILEQGNKVLVFSTFKNTLDEVEYRMNKSFTRYVRCDGDLKDSVIWERKEEFENNPNVKVMLATWSKMGTGYTLTAANYVIFIDTPYTDGAFQQACDRAYRIGTNKNVTIITLITKNTVDERVLEIVESKRLLADYLVDGIISNNLADSRNLLEFLIS